MDPEKNINNERTHLLTGDPPRDRKWWRTCKFIVMSGAGMFADGWDLQVINIMIAILVHLYPGAMTPSKISLTAGMTLIGVIVGQAAFGFFGDIFGRKYCSIATALLTIGGTVASICITDGGFFSIGARLAVCRFFAGVGIGGEYPISAALSREMGNDLCFNQKQLLQINMVMFNTGCLAQAILCLILVAAKCNLEVIWRVACGVGILPSLVALFLRLYLEESEMPHPRAGRLSSYVASGMSLTGSHFSILLGCGLSWCMYNFAIYGESTFSHLIAGHLFGTSAEIYVSLWRSCIFTVIMSGIGFCGVFYGVALLKYLSVKKVQCIGFLGQTIFIWLCCIIHRIHWLRTFFFFVNIYHASFVGMTCYLMSSLYFPKGLRTSAVGIAASLGKAGAAIGASTFPIIDANAGFVWVLFISGGILLSGLCVTILTPFVEAKH